MTSEIIYPPFPGDFLRVNRLPAFVGDLLQWCYEEYSQIQGRVVYVPADIQGKFDELELPKETVTCNVDMMAIADVYEVFSRMRQIRRNFNEMVNHWEDDYDNDRCVGLRISFVSVAIQAVKLATLTGEQRELQHQQAAKRDAEVNRRLHQKIEKIQEAVSRQFADEEEEADWGSDWSDESDPAEPGCDEA